MRAVWLMGMIACQRGHEAATVNPPGMREDSIRQFIYAYTEEIWNRRDFSKAEKYWGPDFKNMFAPEAPHGVEGMKAQVTYFLQAFDSFHIDIQDLIVQGDKIAMWVSISGRHTGPLFGIPPTNREVKFREAVWYKMKDGKLDEVCPFVDFNALFEQLGAYPPQRQ